MSVSMAGVDDIFASLIECVEAIPDTTSSAGDMTHAAKTMQSLVLMAKECHQEVSSALTEQQNAMLEQQTHDQRLLRKIQALQYERLSLERQIALANGFHTTKLVQMARDDLQHDGTDTLTDDDVLSAYFGLEDWSSETNRTSVTARMHQEINARGKLSDALKRQRQELGQLKQKLDEKRKFLDHTLPEQIAAMERASMPLQKAFNFPMLSTERKERLQLAQRLPAPLYTLYNQMQLYIDMIAPASDGTGKEQDPNSKASVTFIHHDSGHVQEQMTDHDQVLLHLPVPNVASQTGKLKRVTLHFRLDGEAPSRVLVSVSGGSMLVQDKFLHELFPRDTASTTAHPHAHAFQWCNYMAGLYSVGMPPALPATRGIMLQLNQRIQASATLKHILTTLQQRKQIPTIPGDADDMKSLSGVKIASFDENTHEMSDQLVSKWTCKLRQGSKTRVFEVEIDMARYPVVPPRWALQQKLGSDTASGHEAIATAAPYDEQLASLEDIVNISVLEDLNSQETDGAADWVLATQLKEILHGCVEMDDKIVSESRKRKHR